MSNPRVDQRKRIIAAGNKAVDELIKIAESSILLSGDDDLSADKLTRAAQAKKIAILDAFEISSRCEQEEIMIEASEGVVKPPPTSWAESNAKPSK